MLIVNADPLLSWTVGPGIEQYSILRVKIALIYGYLGTVAGDQFIGIVKGQIGCMRKYLRLKPQG